MNTLERLQKPCEERFPNIWKIARHTMDVCYSDEQIKEIIGKSNLVMMCAIEDYLETHPVPEDWDLYSRINHV